MHNQKAVEHSKGRIGPSCFHARGTAAGEDLNGLIYSAFQPSHISVRQFYFAPAFDRVEDENLGAFMNDEQVDAVVIRGTFNGYGRGEDDR
jgi:hypothetical protein